MNEYSALSNASHNALVNLKLTNKPTHIHQGVITDVKDGGDVFYIGYKEFSEDISSGATFGFSKEYNIKPKVNDIINIYIYLGSSVRGVDLNGQSVYFKNDEQIDREHQEWLENNKKEKEERFKNKKEELDKKFAALPEVFQRRIQFFRDNNPNFRVDYEDYEMVCCIDAVKIANVLGSVDELKKWQKLDDEEQKEKVPGLDYENHSGNTFGMMVKLAYHYLSNSEMVFFEHGAMTPLTGCADYGCFHPRPGVEEFLAKRGNNGSN